MTYTVEDFAARPRDILSTVSRGEDVVITEDGLPIARVVPTRKTGQRKPDQFRGQIWMADDFDELPEEQRQNV